MENSWMKKNLALGIFLLAIGNGIIPGIAHDINKQLLQTSRGNWLYVGGIGPDNYTRIQDAINHAFDGDTVFVFDESSPYYEHVVINKSIHLIGENQKTTIIDGQNQNSLITVSLIADEITFTGFTVQHAPFNLFGLFVYSNNNTIIGNILSNIHVCDINLMNSNNNNITENTFLNSIFGIGLFESNDNTITRNIITKCGYGIILSNSRRNIISMNNIIDNRHRNASFYKDLGIFPLFNHWDANYWGRPYFFPKIIPGKLIFKEEPLIALPILVNFDWHPALKPYNIEV